LKKLNEKRNNLLNNNNKEEIDLEKELDLDCKKDFLDKKIEKFNEEFNKYSSHNFDLVCYFDKFDNRGNNVNFANDKFKNIYQGHINDIINFDKKSQKK
jgi:hypothetical protein